jgi:hypothetical protein
MIAAMKKKKIDPAASAYLSGIGSKGGKKTGARADISAIRKRGWEKRRMKAALTNA